MNLINTKEKAMIKSIAQNIKKQECIPENIDSVWKKRSSKQQDIHNIIKIYDFNDIAQIKERLEKFWDSIEKTQMKQFIDVSAVSAFKCRNDNEIKKDISAFVYEF